MKRLTATKERREDIYICTSQKFSNLVEEKRALKCVRMLAMAEKISC
jgi:hypothetical protein